MVEHSSRDVLLRPGQFRESAVDVVVDDLLGPAEPAERLDPEPLRSCRPFLVPEPLHHELEIGRLDADDAVAALDGSAAGLADADLAGQHLLQHGVDEFRLDLDPIFVTGEAVVLGDRLDDRRAGGLYVEVLQAQVVAQNARDPALEGVELGKRVLADGEEEVHP